MVSSYRDWVSFDIASHDHHASHINTCASPVPSMQLPTPNGPPMGPLVYSASCPMDYRLPHISSPCPNYSPHPKMDNGLSHPSGFPATASTCILALHPSNHCLHIPLSHPSGCPHPRNDQRAVSSIQHRAPTLADPSNDQCLHIALRPSDHPTSGQWAISHIRHRFLAIVGICISTSRPSNYHLDVPLSLHSLR